MCNKMQNTLFDAMVSCRSLNSYCASYSFVTPAKLVLLVCFVSFSSLNSFSVFFFFCQILVYSGFAFNDLLHFFAFAIRRHNLMQFHLYALFPYILLSSFCSPLFSCVECLLFSCFICNLIFSPST